MPARVDDAKVAEVEPQRQRLEPLDVLGALRTSDLVEEALVLFVVLRAVLSQILPAAGRVLGGVADRIELVIAHHDLGATGVDHGFHSLEDSQLFRSAVDQVADEDRLSLRVSVRPA